MTWYHVFTTEQIEGHLPRGTKVLVQVEEMLICLVHIQSGFYAIQDSCPHLGDSLHRGTLNYLDEIVCPWHSYRFSLKNGEECEQRSNPAKTFPVEVREDGLFIGVEG